MSEIVTVPSDPPALALLIQAYLSTLQQYESGPSDLNKELGAVILGEITHSIGQHLAIGRRIEQAQFNAAIEDTKEHLTHTEEGNVIYPKLWEEMKRGSIDKEDGTDDTSGGDSPPLDGSGSTPDTRPCDTEPKD